MKTVNAIKRLEKEGFDVVETALNSKEYIAFKLGHTKIEFKSDADGATNWFKVGFLTHPTVKKAIERS